MKKQKFIQEIKNNIRQGRGLGLIDVIPRPVIAFKNMITKQQLNTYEAIRRSGVTNMFDIPEVMRLSRRYIEWLDRDDVLEIMKKYGELKNYYDLY